MMDNENAEMNTNKGRVVHRTRPKRKFTRSRLPTPPPDPTLGDEESLCQSGSSEKDVHFLDYINSLQKNSNLSRSDSLFTPMAATEDAFDHLDKLYKLMEQMLNLRQQNAQLQKRIRDLEHLKNLQSVSRQADVSARVSVFENIPELDDDSSLAESILDTMLIGTKKDVVKPNKPWTRSRIRQSLMRKQRTRSSSLRDFDEIPEQRRTSMNMERDKSSKVSKWTKVKAAFRWEKASSSVAGVKSQQENECHRGMLPVNYEIARYLRVPSTSDETGTSPTDFGGVDGSTPGSLSSASSVDDLRRHGEARCTQGDSLISDDDRHSINSKGSGIRSTSNKVAYPKVQKCSEKMRRKRHQLDEKISDNEEVFEEENRDEIPASIVVRYRQAVAEAESTNKQNPVPKSVSKWTMVKKAFLTASNANTTFDNKHISHNAVSSSTLALGNPKEIQPQKSEDETKKIQDEIQKNYRQLQKKLSLEFQNKLQEWDKVKSTGATNSRCEASISDEQRDPAFMKKMEEWQRMKSQPSNRTSANVQMIREEDLAPEFKKKLEEWQKIKKCSARDDSASAPKSKKKLGEWPKWKSVSSHREEHINIEQQPLSDEFIKKLEEWRKIKEASRREDVKEKTPSPRTSRRHHDAPSSPYDQNNKRKGHQDQKELQWFENELDKIEKEKQRLEREREKFLQREERLSKLRRTVMGEGNKKDVLIHMPSGFYRFEGISRKFTQKLCQWEKAKGIGPEASTFALLTSNFTPHITVDLYETDPPASSSQYANGPPRLMRSKSAESLAILNSIQSVPPASHHPSSLSLNDVEELEKQCLAISRESSLQDMDGSYEEKIENEEPEAVIVEIEDVVEETAAPLEECLQEKHFPVYQRESALNTCQEVPLVPCLHKADSKNVQYSYFLMEDIMDSVQKIVDSENAAQAIASAANSASREGCQDGLEAGNQNSTNNKHKNEVQKRQIEAVMEKLRRLQEIHSRNISEITMEGRLPTSSHFSDLLEEAQDLFSDLHQMTEEMQKASSESSKYDTNETKIRELASEICGKLAELKRTLTYFYAASDMTAPGRKVKAQKKASPDTAEKGECSKDNCENPNKQSSGKEQEERLISKRMKYKKKTFYSKTVRENEDEQKSSDFDMSCQEEIEEENETVTLDQVIVEKLVIPTKTKYVTGFSDTSEDETKKPVEVFVKTTRKLFTPLVNEARVPKIVVPNSSSSSKPTKKIEKSPILDKKNEGKQEPVAHLPPPTSSPAPQRKTSKEISPSIRLMLAKYNQMIGQDGVAASKSAGSSGSASPVAWRSPVSERRVIAQRERYMKEVSKEVKKSASVSILNLGKKFLTTATQHHGQSTTVSSSSLENSNTKISRGILRSTSASVIQNNNAEKSVPSLKLVIPENSASDKGVHSSEIRSSKLKRAKEKFFNSSPIPTTSGPSSAPPVFQRDLESVMKYPTRSRFSQISVGSESSYDSSTYEGMLIKSASAGMINVDEDTYREIDPAVRQEGYVSLPRASLKKQKEGFLGGKLALSNIAAKFRKVKMRRNKDQKKLNTVSALCRQSLVVNINSASQESLPTEAPGSRSDSLTVPVNETRASSSEDTSPSSSRSGSWIRRSRIFKVL